MQIFAAPEPLRNFLSGVRCTGKTIGLVPTMGALHKGHLSLVEKSVQHSDLTVCSIYINPQQFNEKEDLLHYPRTLEQDFEMLQAVGCQAVFCPDDTIMYPATPAMTINFGPLEQVMEGKFRRGHFNGVALVVAKLFHIVQPDHAYFGQKDWQQLAIIKQMVSDLSFDLEVIAVPIVREKDGLALSSRNKLLIPEHRKIAGALHQALTLSGEVLESTGDPVKARAVGIEHLAKHPEIRLEYLEIVHAHTLGEPDRFSGEEPISICLAAWLGKVRLIDNVGLFI